ncbi:MAG: NAD(P)/FAD-dependent oxidoreductase [Defluviitaleaceae bacterium]|nr:NAD(P)/FAD-dependent oxidoreductase [Defluviitaleaceae bacterium]
MIYDFIIVGAGPAGIFAAYEAMKLAPDAKVLLLERGQDIYARKCPILQGKIKFCPTSKGDKLPAGCLPACSITSGFGGAGAYSDGKFNITTEFGGWLGEYMPHSKLLKLINYVDSINLSHGAPNQITDPDTEEVRLIEQKVYGAGMKLLRAKVRHLGTEINLKVMQSIFDFLQDKIEMRFAIEVTDILTSSQDSSGIQKATGVITADGYTLEAKNILIAPGRDGSAWLADILSKRKIPMACNQVDIGVRAEVSDVVMQDINRHLYEAKLIFNSSTGMAVRTFCANPSGHVVVENHSGVMAANGHAFFDPQYGSRNTNFALLVSHKFTSPFNKPNEYAREICKRANDLSNGGVIIQRFGDLIRGRRSTEKRIREGFLEPTLKEAMPGDLGLVLPYNTLKSIVEMTYALDVVTPGFASDSTLFYGVEAKFYSARPNLDSNLQTAISGLYCAGDGAGVTRGLAQAGAAGVHVARNIFSK